MEDKRLFLPVNTPAWGIAMDSACCDPRDVVGEGVIQMGGAFDG